MRIAVLGATSQIAKDLVLSFAAQNTHELVLYARRPQYVSQWLADVNLTERYPAYDFEAFTADKYFEVVINFVGVGNPAQAASMGASIFDVTLKYDQMALDYLRRHPLCRYIFLSSGAVFGSNFEEPVNESSKTIISVNDLQPEDWYAVAKFHAECRHRSLVNLPIVDVRVFNYFSHTQDLQGRFLITDILRSIREKKVLQTAADYIMRDFLHPRDFYNLISALIAAPTTNVAVDCYSRAPIGKSTLLMAMKTEFGLQYETSGRPASVNATRSKPHYYTRNTRAADFGYKPTLSSLEGVLLESGKILTRICSE